MKHFDAPAAGAALPLPSFSHYLDPHYPAHLLSPQATPGAAPNAEERTTAQLCAQRAAQRVYDEEFSRCPRSPEWKAGALRGLRVRAGLAPNGCPYPNGTAQADAWTAGCQAGLAEGRWRAEWGGL